MHYLEFKILEYKGRGDKKVGDIIIARWFEIIEPNFKDHQNTEIDIIGLIDKLDSDTTVNERGHLYYERLYLYREIYLYSVCKRILIA